MTGKRIIVHSLADACAALKAASEAGVPVTLASAEGAGGYAGPLWFKSLVDEARAAFPDVAVAAVLDCGDEAGTALAALRHGLAIVRFAGRPEAAERLRDIARSLGAAIETGPAPAALDLLDRPEAEAACRAYLRGEAAPKMSRAR